MSDDELAAMMAARIITDAEDAAEAYFTAGPQRGCEAHAFMAWATAVPFLPESVGQRAGEVFEQRFAALAGLN